MTWRHRQAEWWADRRWRLRHRRCVRILKMRPEFARDYVALHPDALDAMCDECRARLQARLVRFARQARPWRQSRPW